MAFAAASNLPPSGSGTSPDSPHRLTRSTSAPLRAGNTPISSQLCQPLGGGAEQRVGSCCLGRRHSLLGSSLSHWGIPLPHGRPTSAPMTPILDPARVSTFHTHETRPGWAPSLSRGRWCPPGRAGMTQPAPAASQRPAPTTSLPRPTAKHPQSPDIIQGFTVVHPSGLPLARSPRMEREPSGFPPSSAPCRYQQRTSGRGPIIRTLIRNYTLDLIEPPTVKHSHCVRPRVALPPCGVPVSESSVRPVSVITPALRNAFTNARTCLSFTRRRTKPIRAV